MPVRRQAISTLWIALGVWSFFAAMARADERVDFARDIRPILAARCHECHGPAKQESGLRLDRAGALAAGGNSGPAIVAGKAGESLLIQAVRGGGDAISKMPPEGPPLEPPQIALLARWIDEGAALPAEGESLSAKRTSDHWSFQPIVAVEPPKAQNTVWGKSPLDAFVLARLEAAGLAPSPEADKATLVRRLSLDLIGLPPSVEEVDAFLADTRGDAYERLVDRLLSSPHYGERWGRHWLDLARYADSNGYTIDGGRSIWKYRDWVIDALNRDLPFDQFTIEQLAGDMLTGARSDQIIATGFHRNTLVNEEGGTDPEQFRVEAIVDRVSTTGAVFLGLTLGCARCHDHKYDPISQREFYEVFALFNNADEPTLSVPTDQQAKEMPALLAEIEQSQKRLVEVEANAGGRQGEWESRFAGRTDVAWSVLDVEATSEGGATITKLADGSLLVAGSIPDRDVYTIAAALGGQRITAIRLEALTHDSLPNHGPGLGETGNFVLGELTAQVADPSAPDGARRLDWSEAWADYGAPKGGAAQAIDGKRQTGWNILATKDGNVPRTAIFYLRDDLAGSAGRKLTLVCEQKAGLPRHQIGRFRLSATGADRDVLKLPPEVRQVLAVPAGERSKEQKELLRLEYQKIDPERVPLAKRIAELEQSRKQMAAAITTTLVLHERSEPRDTHIHLRGDFLHPGAVVAPATPAVLPPLVARGERPDRLDFARWLVDRRHPLTARVTVNRIWQAYFGQGLVATENDFGLQGDRPSHPELLDWLASAFVDGGWSLKALHRLIVTSATYQQTSQARADLTAADPYNRLLGRQLRLRLEAESIRDAALAASGLLSREIGGPGVYPPQPQGIYKFTQQVKFWGENKDSDRYRRGMYTYLWRSSPYPFLKTFDAPDGVVACTRRSRSNTPLQALTLANDRAFYEIAQGLAGRILNVSADEDARIRLAFRRCLAREPGAGELASLGEYLATERARFEAAPTDAAAVAPPGIPASASPSEAAAWTMLARVLLNLDEFITRE